MPKIENLGAPIDVLWMRLPHRPGDPEQSAGWFDRGRVLVMLDRRDYWQVAYLMPKGSKPRDGSLEVFKERLVSAQPQLREHVNDLRSWDDTSQLDVRVDRAKASDLGVSVSDVAATLETLLGGRRVTQFQRGNQQYDVLVQVEPFFMKNDDGRSSPIAGTQVSVGENEVKEGVQVTATR